MSEYLSVCLIVKNEEKILAECLGKFIEYTKEYRSLYEILVVDTGSTDNTIDIAKKYGARVEFFEWVNDFAKARNYAMSKASNNLILFLDADEIAESCDIKKIISLHLQYPHAIGRLKRRNLCKSGEGKETTILCDPVERLFDRRLFKYEGCIHEQVTSIEGKPLEGYDIPLVVYHEGYYGTDEELARKAKRNNDLLFKQLEEDDKDPYIYYQIAKSYGIMGDFEKQCEYFKFAYELNPDRKLEYVASLIVGYGNVLDTLKKFDELKKLITDEFDDYKDYADFLSMAGKAYVSLYMYDKAVDAYEAALKTDKYSVEGTNGDHSLANLASIYEGLKNEEKAIAYLEKANNLVNDKKYESKIEEIRKSKEFGIKFFSIIILVDDSSKNIDSLLDSIKNQSVGINHMEIIIYISTNDSDVLKRVSKFEQENTESVLLIYSESNAEEYDNKNNVEDIKYVQLMNAIAYVNTDKLMITDSNTKLEWDCLRLFYGSLNQIGAQIVCDNIHYSAAPDTDFLLEIKNQDMRNAVKSIGFLKKGYEGKMFLTDFLFANEITIEEIINDSIEEKYADKVYCISRTLIN